MNEFTKGLKEEKHDDPSQIYVRPLGINEYLQSNLRPISCVHQ